MKKFSFVFLLLVLLFSCKSEKKTIPIASVDSQEINYLEESEADFNERMEWWRDARFGMFIHWGVYAVPAGTHNGKQIENIGEWIQFFGKIPVKDYEKYAKQFNPTEFDADTWAKTMKDAGMKYMVITSKHHDGFGLWNSEVSNYNITDFSPYGKDILKALSAACKKQGIKFGLYHSIMDWHHPDAQFQHYLRPENDSTDYKTRFVNYLENYMKPQLKELVDNYDPDILWFDGEWVGEYTHEQGQELYQYVRSLNPSIIINNRVDKGRQGMKGMNKEDRDYAGDFGTPEQEVLETASALDWESCMTMNDTWGFKSYDHNWKSAEVLIHNLIDITAKGGNYLLNVGPTAEGIIPEPSVKRLKTIGKWLKINGDAIYKTERLQKDYKQGDDIRFTKTKGSDDIYATTLKKPEKALILKNIKPEANSDIKLLGVEKALNWEFVEGEGTKITIPAAVLNTWNAKAFAWVLHIKGKEI